MHAFPLRHPGVLWASEREQGGLKRSEFGNEVN
jgi:hypothetical protein